LHWQYWADTDAIKPTEGNPLKIEKTLFRKAPDGTLSTATETAGVGDEWVIRLTIFTDQDLEFVHLTDQHAGCTEPVNVLSSYKRNGALTYFESTRDSATHFFIDSLPKGRHVLEHTCRVQLRGKCRIGPAEIQCLYAPEFAARSAASQVEVK
jgi:hypothetical protein